MSIILNNQSIAGKYIYKEYIPQSYRYIGEIFQSMLPIEDIRVALLDGHIIASSDGYGDFIQHLTSLSLIYPQLICTEDEWQTSNTTYGECGKFVINNDGSIRLPKIVSFVQGLKSLADLANIVEAGLPNITGKFDGNCNGYTATYSATGAFYKTQTQGANRQSDSNGDSDNSLGFDASLSNSIYGNSNTVQPQAIQYPYYIVLATGVTQEITAKEELVVNNSNVLGDSKYSNLDIENTSWLKSEGQKNYRDNYPDYYDWIVKEYNGTSNNLKKDINVDKIGDLTVKDGVLSGFSASNYALIDKVPSNISSFEIVIKCRTASTISNQGLLGQGVATNFITPQIGITAKGRMYYQYSTNGTSWIQLSADRTPSINTNYWHKLLWDGSTISAYYSIDGVNYILEDSNTLTTAPVWSNRLQIGGDEQDSNYWQGSIDLKESYININGQRWWTGYRKNIVLENEQHTEYDYILNENEQSFILPLLDGSEDLPSDRYEDLTLLASGSTYTATANGWFEAQADSMCWIHPITNMSAQYTTNNLGPARGCFPCAKGDQVLFYYSSNVFMFRFIYAQGNGSLYYYVGDVAKNPSLVNVGAITNTLTKKVDIDAKNFSTNGKSLISSYGMPSNKYIDLTIGASGTTYTAPANGWFTFNGIKSGLGQVLFARTSLDSVQTSRYVQDGAAFCIISPPARKNDTYVVAYDNAVLNGSVKFIYAESEI